MPILRMLAFAAGLALVATFFVSAMRVTLLLRRRHDRLVSVAARTTRRVFDLLMYLVPANRRSGLQDYLAASIEGATRVHPDIFAGASEKKNGHGSAEWAVAFVADADPFVSSYCNTIPTHDGGTHETGLRTALFKGLRDHAARVGQEKRAAAITSEFIHVAAVYDRNAVGNQDILTLYVNGQAVGVTTTNGNQNNLNDWSNNNGAGLGRVNDQINATAIPGLGGAVGTYGAFQGEIALFRFYNNNALSAAQALDNFQDV